MSESSSNQGLRVCTAELCDHGDNSESHCGQLHLCERFVDGKCSKYPKKTCLHSHRIFAKYNKEVLREHGVNTNRHHYHVMKDVRSLLTRPSNGDVNGVPVTEERDTKLVNHAISSGSTNHHEHGDARQKSIKEEKIPGGQLRFGLNGSLREQLCKSYLGSGCDDRCHELHLCKYYIQGKCFHPGRCRWLHDINHEHNRRVLENHNVDIARAHDLGESNTLLQRSGRNSDFTRNGLGPSNASCHPCTVDRRCTNLLQRGHFRMSQNPVTNRAYPAARPSSEPSKRSQLQLCSLYHYGRCESGVLCGKIHLCRYYVESKCYFYRRRTCKWLHDVYHEHNRIVLQSYGINGSFVVGEIRGMLRHTMWLQTREDIKYTSMIPRWSPVIPVITSTVPCPRVSSFGNQASFPDRIAYLANEKFKELDLRRIAQTNQQVLSALIMKSNQEDRGKVISIGTGTRCIIDGNLLELRGEQVNDSHAEIIARRGFIRFLYRELKDHGKGNCNSIFEFSWKTGKMKVKDCVSFHLYISRAPCGFDAKNSEHSGPEALFVGKPPGHLHTKGDGKYIPVENGFKNPSLTGPYSSRRLRTMSCSDKVCRWNVLGLQGGLLSLLLDPVYLSSITLGNQYDHESLSLVAYGRLHETTTSDPITGLPVPYEVNTPLLGSGVGSYGKPLWGENPAGFNVRSINWNLGALPEVTGGNTGRLLDNFGDHDYTASRLSKRILLKDFTETCQVFKREDLLRNTYFETKASATDHQKAKEAMVEQFRWKGLGNWIKKPIEEELFFA